MILTLNPPRPNMTLIQGAQADVSVSKLNGKKMQTVKTILNLIKKRQLELEYNTRKDLVTYGFQKKAQMHDIQYKIGCDKISHSYLEKILYMIQKSPRLFSPFQVMKGLNCTKVHITYLRATIYLPYC